MGLCQEISEKYGIHVEFTERDVPSDIQKDVALCLFRIAQEALSNVVRHSKAEEAQVELCGINNELRLRVADSGLGFDSAHIRPDKGIGLVSMRERLRLVGGKLLIQSEPGRGTEIVAKVLLSDPAWKARTAMTERGATL
jgi:signal transduction histidine kinase